jgi:translation initiation factor IF-1
MSKEDLVSTDGRVTDLLGGGRYKIKLETGHEILAILCGKMKRFSIRVMIGDKVTVGISPYDMGHGLILYRFK